MDREKAPLTKLLEDTGGSTSDNHLHIQNNDLVRVTSSQVVKTTGNDQSNGIQLTQPSQQALQSKKKNLLVSNVSSANQAGKKVVMGQNPTGNSAQQRQLPSHQRVILHQRDSYTTSMSQFSRDQSKSDVAIKGRRLSPNT